MLNDYKLILGGLAVVIAFIGYFFYIRDIVRGKTKPHAFSWLMWGLLEAVAFFAQIAKDGGAGSWVTGAGALIAIGVSIVGFVQKEKDIKFVDWLALSGGLIGIVLWQVTSNPLLAVISVTVADAVAFVPTFRKGYHKPQEETLIEYALSSVKWGIGIFALQSLNLTTWLYPASLIITNGSFVVMAAIRRRQLQK